MFPMFCHYLSLLFGGFVHLGLRLVVGEGFENEFLPFLWGEIHTACFPALESSTFPAVPPGKQNILSNNVHVYCMARTISEDTQWHFVFNEGYSKCTLESEIANYSPGMHVTPISFQPVLHIFMTIRNFHNPVIFFCCSFHACDDDEDAHLWIDLRIMPDYTKRWHCFVFVTRLSRRPWKHFH